jgi:hypothetical protein
MFFGLVARMEPTGRANARPMTGSAKSGNFVARMESRIALRSVRPRITALVFARRANQQKPVQPPLQKYSCFVLLQISSLITPSRPTRGAYRDRHGRGTGCGGRGSAIDEQRLSGRRRRVVLTPRRWCQVGGSNSADDGGKRARSPGRARSSPLKPLRAGMPGCSGGLVVTNARVYYTPRAAAGASAPGIPHALYWAEVSCTTRAHRAARMRRCIRNCATRRPGLEPGPIRRSGRFGRGCSPAFAQQYRPVVGSRLKAGTTRSAV